MREPGACSPSLQIRFYFVLLWGMILASILAVFTWKVNGLLVGLVVVYCNYMCWPSLLVCVLCIQRANRMHCMKNDDERFLNAFRLMLLCAMCVLGICMYVCAILSTLGSIPRNSCGDSSYRMRRPAVWVLRLYRTYKKKVEF